jgi:hypothetical protein
MSFGEVILLNTRKFMRTRLGGRKGERCEGRDIMKEGERSRRGGKRDERFTLTIVHACGGELHTTLAFHEP